MARTALPRWEMGFLSAGVIGDMASGQHTLRGLGLRPSLSS